MILGGVRHTPGPSVDCPICLPVVLEVRTARAAMVQAFRTPADALGRLRTYGALRDARLALHRIRREHYRARV